MCCYLTPVGGGGGGGGEGVTGRGTETDGRRIREIHPDCELSWVMTTHSDKCFIRWLGLSIIGPASDASCCLACPPPPVPARYDVWRRFPTRSDQRTIQDTRGCVKLKRILPFLLWAVWLIILIDSRVCKNWKEMRYSLVHRAFDCQCRSRNSRGFDPSILPHIGIWGSADEAVLNTVHRKNLNELIGILSALTFYEENKYF
jgi:hypothetical protein